MHFEVPLVLHGGPAHGDVLRPAGEVAPVVSGPRRQAEGALGHAVVAGLEETIRKQRVEIMKKNSFWRFF